MTFRGIPRDVLDFYVRLEADNTKSFWEANKTVYRDVVKASVADLCAELSEYGPFHLFRPYQDARFAKGRPPYKTHQGAYGESEGGAGHYLQIGPQGLMVASGYYTMMRDQLERFRAAVDDDKTGRQIERIVTGLSRTYRIGAIDELKTAPKGFAKDHPRIELLRRKGLMMSLDAGSPSWIHTKTVIARIKTVWEAAAPMNAWLDRHVGPTTMAMEGMFS
jgi:uncharacterized protein (TIGR02453 family)